MPAETQPPGWLTTRETAARLGMSTGHVGWLIEHEHLVGAKHLKRLWIEPQSVERLASERSRWTSLVAAAELAGCSTATVLDAARRGDIASRSLGRAYPSLDQESVTAWAEQRHEQKAAAAARQQELARQRQLAGRPDLEHDWLTQDAVAELLGLSHVRIGQLARAERLPCVVVGRRRWFRRDHVELVAAARASARENFLG